MKTWTVIVKIMAALATVAGIVYVIATYGDKIVAFAKRVLGCEPCDECDCECDECDCVDECECIDECAEEVEEVAEEADEADEAAEEETVVAAEDDFEG